MEKGGDASALAGITGLGEHEASIYLEAYGDIERATNAFFDGRVPAALQKEEEKVEEDHFEPPEGEFYELVWGTRERISAAWLQQTFTNFEGPGLVQTKNGPCGLLCCLNAILIVRLLLVDQLRLSQSATGILQDISFSVEEVIDSIASIIERCSPTNECKLVVWKKEIGGDIVIMDVQSGEHIRSEMQKREDLFLLEGCCALMLYSCLFSRGLEKVKAEFADCDEKSFVTGPFWLGTMEMMSLLLMGHVVSSFSGYLISGSKNALAASDVGLLSFLEVETGVPICDGLKHPNFPVWIVHGGDHFTLLYALEATPSEPESVFDLYHWNGLPPGKSHQKIRILLDEQEPVVRMLPEKQGTTYFKPRVGEIDEVIQAHPKDREKSDYYSDWRYEVILAIDNKDDASETRPEEFESEYPTYELAQRPSGEWRCANCYRNRFRNNMCFGLNQIPSDVCCFCQKPKEEAGWTVYLRYKDLPRNIKKKIQKHYGHKLLNILKTRWPNCETTWEDDDNVPSC